MNFSVYLWIFRFIHSLNAFHSHLLWNFRIHTLLFIDNTFYIIYNGYIFKCIDRTAWKSAYGISAEKRILWITNRVTKNLPPFSKRCPTKRVSASLICFPARKCPPVIFSPISPCPSLHWATIWRFSLKQASLMPEGKDFGRSIPSTMIHSTESWTSCRSCTSWKINASANRLNTARHRKNAAKEKILSVTEKD